MTDFLVALAYSRRDHTVFLLSTAEPCRLQIKALSLECIIRKPLTDFSPISPVFSSDYSKQLLWMRVQISMLPPCESSEHEANALQRLPIIICSLITTELVISPSSKE